MIRTLHITNAFPYDDTPEYGIFIKEQIESLPSDKVTSEIIFINGRKIGKKAYIKAIFDIRKKAGDVDVIHCHHVYSFIIAFASGVVGKKPIVLSFLNDWTHEIKDIPFSWLRKFICKFCTNKSSKVIFKSPIPTDLKRHSNVVNLPNGVDSDFFRIKNRDDSKKILGLDIETNYILFVSSKNKYREQKRYDIFNETLSIIKNRLPEKKISEYSMVGQPRELVPIIFSACDIHLLTSDYEGSPNSIKESLCCGTSVVSRNVGNVKDMLEGVVGSEVIDSNSPDALALATLNLLNNPRNPNEIRNSFIQKGLTKQLVANRLINIYLDVIQKNRN